MLSEIRILRDGRTSSKSKTVAASALSQTRKGGKTEMIWRRSKNLNGTSGRVPKWRCDTERVLGERDG